MRSTFLAETPTTSYQWSTFSKGNLDEIGNTTFIPMLLSTIICPQYLKGWGSVVVSVHAHHPCRSPHRPPSHLYASSSSTSSHTARRETATSSRYSYALTPNAHIPWQKALLLYYLIVVLERNTLYFNTLDALYMNPKGSQALCFHTWRASWTYVRHILDTPCSLVTANIRSNLQRIAVFRLLSMSQKSHKSFCRGFNVKKSDFLNTFRV